MTVCEMWSVLSARPGVNKYKYVQLTSASSQQYVSNILQSLLGLPQHPALCHLTASGQSQLARDVQRTVHQHSLDKRHMLLPSLLQKWVPLMCQSNF